jgi:pimeloyl-ACP methyl ester carboxylesterase
MRKGEKQMAATQRLRGLAGALCLFAGLLAAPGLAAEIKDGYFTTSDWRDVIPRIDIPTLIVGGRASLVGWRSQVWIGSQIRGSSVEIFEEDEGGNHFMFMENPEKFNRLVKDFMG